LIVSKRFFSMMTERQKKYLRYLTAHVCASEERWKEICQRYGIHSIDELFSLDKEKASELIRELLSL